jgi:hypothetical protein
VVTKYGERIVANACTAMKNKGQQFPGNFKHIGIIKRTPRGNVCRVRPRKSSEPCTAPALRPRIPFDHLTGDENI